MGSQDTKKLIPILVLVGVLMCGCVALPVVGGIGMLSYWGMRSEPPEEMVDDVAGGGLVPQMPGEFGQPITPVEAAPSDFGSDAGGGQSSGAKQAAYTRMLEAEQRYLLANAQYEAAQ